MATAIGPVVESWHDFYMMIGGAAGALLGLLFTTMTLRGNSVAQPSFALEHDIWAVASVPLTSFLDILLLSAVFLVPDQTQLGLAAPVLALSVLGIAQMAWVQQRSWIMPANRIRQRLLPAAVCYLAQAVVAGTILAGATSLWILALIVGALIVNASLTVWTLLREPILSRVDRAAESPADDHAAR